MKLAVVVAGCCLLLSSPDAFAQKPASTLRVVGVKANDVVNVRELPTEKSRVLGVIPPDATDIQATGEVHGPWIFIRFENVEG